MNDVNDLKNIAKGVYYRLKGDCIFCKMVEQNKKEKIVYQNENVAVFPPLKKDVLAEGHLLVIPKKHYENIFDIPEDELKEVTHASKKIAEKLEEDEELEGVNILHASGKEAQQSVNHFHIHLVPRRKSEDLDLWPETEYTEERFTENYSRIRESLEALK